VAIMNKLILALAVSSFAPWASAQVGVSIEIGLPVQPQVVEVEPGVRIVEGVDEEVFYSGGWYWCRRGDGWYRARSPRAHFFWVDRHRVPVALARMPEGRYRNWRRADHPEWRGPHHERAAVRRESGHPWGGMHEGHDRGAPHDRGHEGRPAERAPERGDAARREHHEEHR